MNSKYTFIPNNLDLNKLVEETPPVNSSVTKDTIAFMLGNWYQTASIKYKDFTKTGFVNLSSKIMQGFFRDYKFSLDYLLNTKIIESDGKFIRGEKCMGYCISNQYLSGITEYEYKSKHFTYILGKNLRDYEQNKDVKLKNYHFLSQWFKCDYLKFDYLAACDFNYLNFKNAVGKNNTPLYSIYDYTLKKIQKYDYTILVDDTSGRFHSPLTNVKTEFRQFFSYQGQKLFQIDITNAQPYFSQVLFKKEFWDTSIYKLEYAYKPDISSTISSIYYTLVKTEVTLGTKDLELYLKSVNSGQFYEGFLMNILEKYPNLGYDRDKCKTIIYQVLFSDNRYMSDEKRIFKEIYPTAYKIFSFIKRRKKHKNDLSILLQNIESYLVIECCCRRIAMERPDCPIYTIHDSISTTEENLEYVKYVMVDEITKFIGVPPNLKVEQW